MGVQLCPRDAQIPCLSLFKAQNWLRKKDRVDLNTTGGVREGVSSGVKEVLTDCLREAGRLPAGGGTGSQGFKIGIS